MYVVKFFREPFPLDGLLPMQPGVKCALRKRVRLAQWQMALLRLLGFPIGAAQPIINTIEHYIVPDTRTKKQRFYSLQVSL